MRLSRFLASVLAALLLSALVGSAPVQAVALVANPLATTVTGACTGGPGRLSLTVHPPADGRFRVSVAARGLAEGSRWTGVVFHLGDDPDDAGYKDFRRVAVDGAWTVTARFPAGAEFENDAFFVEAQQRRFGAQRCSLLTQPSPAVGSADCNSRRRQVALLARERDDGSTVVATYIFGARRDSRWHLTLTATGAASRQVVEFDDHADGGRFEKSRVHLTGVDDPRLRLVATSHDRGRCFIRFDPSDAPTDAPLKGRGFGQLIGLPPSS